MDRQPQSNRVRDMEQYRRRHRQKHKWPRWLKVTLALVLLLGAAIFMNLKSDLFSAEQLRILLTNIAPDTFRVGGLPQSADFISSDDNRFSIYRKQLAVLAQDGLHLYDSDGEAARYTGSYTMGMLQCQQEALLCYEMNGNDYCLLYKGNVVAQGQSDNPLMGGCVNGRGSYALVTQERGYEGVITVSDRGMQQLYRWYSAKRRVLCLALSDDERTLCAALLNKDGLSAGSDLCFFSLKQEEPTATITLSNELVLSIQQKKDGGYFVITSNALRSYDEKGTQQGEFLFTGGSLSSFGLCEEGAAVLLSGGMANSSSGTVTLLNQSCQQTGSLSVASALSLNVGKDGIAALSTGQIVFLQWDGTVVFSASIPLEARTVLVAGDQQAYWISSGSAQIVKGD